MIGPQIVWGRGRYCQRCMELPRFLFWWDKSWLCFGCWSRERLKNLTA